MLYIDVCQCNLVLDWGCRGLGHGPASADDWLLDCAVDADHDIADLLAGLDVPVRLDDLVQPIPPVDDRGERPGLDQVPELPHPLLVMLGWDREHDLLAAGQQRDERQERVLGQRAQVRGEIDAARFEALYELDRRRADIKATCSVSRRPSG